MKKIYFISGLPRSGSTLLCNLLAQNPKFNSTATSGCLDVLFAIRNNWDTLIEHKAGPCPERQKNVLKAAFAAYHSDMEKPIVFDKSRGWLAYIEFIENIIGEKVKVLVPIRPVIDILASFEMLYRETSKVRRAPGEAENYFQFQTVQGRCNYWMKPEQPVGLALSRLGDVTRRGLSDRLHFVQFDKFTSNPGQSMKEIYAFLGEKYFEHNFNHVEQVTKEDDDVFGFVNLHKIRNKIEPVKSRAREVLGQDICEFFTKSPS